MEVKPATAIGAVVRYVVIAAGTALGVASEELLVSLAAGLVAVGTAVYGILKTRAAEKAA